MIDLLHKLDRVIVYRPSAINGYDGAVSKKTLCSERELLAVAGVARTLLCLDVFVYYGKRTVGGEVEGIAVCLDAGGVLKGVWARKMVCR